MMDKFANGNDILVDDEITQDNVKNQPKKHYLTNMCNIRMRAIR